MISERILMFNSFVRTQWNITEMVILDIIKRDFLPI